MNRSEPKFDDSTHFRSRDIRSNVVVVVRCSFHSGFATVCVAGFYSLGYNNIQIRRFNALLWISKTLTVITSTIVI